MPLPARKHFPLDEVAQAWGTTAELLLEFGTEGQIEIAVPLFGTSAELCMHMEGQGKTVLSTREELWGIQRLFAEDIWRLHGHGSIRLGRVKGSDADCWYDLHGSPLEVTRSDLVITAQERSRFESEHELVQDVGDEAPFTHSLDYKTIALGGRQFTLSPKRAAVVRLLHQAWLADRPWMQGEVLLQQAGSESSRVVDLFGPLEGWRTILCSDNAGNWRLNLPDLPRQGAIKRAFRRPWLRLVR